MCRLIPLGRALLLALLLVVLTTGVSAAQAPTPAIIITEVQAANTRTMADDQGGYPDWIELHNPTNTSIPLLGYTLTDDPAAPTKWPFPVTTLEPGAFRVIWASGRDQVTPEGWHTSFRLNRGGEYVGLFGPDGQLVDEVTFGPQVTDVSLGRLGTEFDQWVFFPTPTPGKANTTSPRAPPGAPPVTVTPGSGFFAGPVTVQLAAPLPESTVYYTLDGSHPTVGGEAYTAPLEVRETTVLRAVALRDGVPVSAMTTVTYLVGESTGRPVLSLVTDPAHLWDEATGIYVNPQERGREWERPVTVEWLSPEGEVGFSVGAGLRIHGGGSRRESTKRSFRLYFRGEYGPRELAYPLFGVEPGQSLATAPAVEGPRQRASTAGVVASETYDRLVLRAGADDGWQCRGGSRCVEEAMYVRDQLVRDLHGAMGQVAARGRWVSVYLNGGYWGLYNLTERIDERFLATHFGHDDWDLVEAATEGHPEEHEAWEDLADWLTSTDLSAATEYERAVQQLDIESFTSFIILWLWAGGPHWDGGDWYAARMRGRSDARWQLFMWDTESAFDLGQETDATEDVTFSPIVISSVMHSFLASLLTSPQYQTYFTAQAERHLAGALATESVRERLTALGAELRPAMAAEAVRWRPDQEPATAVAQWEAALKRVSDRLEVNAQRLLHLSDPEKLRPLLPQLPVPDTPTSLPLLLPDTRIAFLVGQPTELMKGDAAVMAHLKARGATVTVFGAGDSSTPDPAQVAASYDLLLISSTIQDIDTATRYAQNATPLIFWGPRLLAVTQLTPWGSTRDHETYIRIVDTDHPITAGLSADQHLFAVRRPDTFSIAWPRKGPGVQALAMHRFGDDYAILAAEAGAELVNGQPARARTVFLFWHDTTFHRSTGEMVRLFDRAVDWALGIPSDDGA